MQQNPTIQKHKESQHFICIISGVARIASQHHPKFQQLATAVVVQQQGQHHQHASITNMASRPGTSAMNQESIGNVPDTNVPVLVSLCVAIHCTGD